MVTIRQMDVQPALYDGVPELQEQGATRLTVTRVENAKWFKMTFDYWNGERKHIGLPVSDIPQLKEILSEME